MKLWKRKISTLIAPAMAWLVFGCVGVNPAAPPAPLAEIPSAISLPESVGIDTSEVGGVGGSSLLAFRALNTVKAQVQDIGGEFFEAITFGFNTNQLTDAAVGAVLGELSLLDFPVNPVTRTFQANNAFGGTPVKVDFADYDFDGDGQAEGCTGCTCPTGCDTPCPSQAPPESLRPVCYRIWNDPFDSGEYVPLMAGILNQIRIKDDPNTPEDEENAGVGSYRVQIRQFDDPKKPPLIITHAGANYDHRNPARPLDRTTEYFLTFEERDTLPPPDATVSFVTVEQKGIGLFPSEDSLLKTIRESINQPVSEDPNANSTFQYIARYRTDFDFWSGTFQDFLKFTSSSAFAVPPDIENFSAECAQLSTAIGVDELACQNLGIDVSQVPFLDLVLPGDPRVNLPADFPPTPSF